jgi:hypothetical protein
MRPRGSPERELSANWMQRRGTTVHTAQGDVEEADGVLKRRHWGLVVGNVLGDACCGGL